MPSVSTPTRKAFLAVAISFVAVLGTAWTAAATATPTVTDEPRRTVGFADLWCNPEADWEKFEYLILSQPDNLSARQRPASLAWAYFLEVRNGGHLQYFNNINVANDPKAVVPETIAALRQIGGTAFADVLSKAFARWVAVERVAPVDLKAYAKQSEELEFHDLDTTHHDLNMPDRDNLRMTETDRFREAGETLLKAYFAAHRSWYIDYAPATAADSDLPLRTVIGRGKDRPTLHMATWRKLVDHPHACVRLQAARELIPLDRAAAISTLRSLRTERTVKTAAERELVALREKI
jgi:Domain of unknown function (DUF4375)